ncbi:hypothetical protein [Candidatus Endomicrobiellum devescovinae]|uniref:hypothetical protein n=1 Tax=Candidatus Endomicrobiellum devescovinae TaxID=3242322 RepID=UPI002822F560|nr:hypothetical protein [Endomicrobium sp.]MDR1433911.1 hypothetical protein [Endomicrobium sp.]
MKRLIILTIALCFSITVLGHTVTREDCDRYYKICSNIPYINYTACDDTFNNCLKDVASQDNGVSFSLKTTIIVAFTALATGISLSFCVFSCIPCSHGW